MTKDEALKLALEALEESVDLVREDYENAKTLYGKYPSRQARLLGMEDGLLKHENAITAIKQALAAPVQEPVAWRYKQRFLKPHHNEWYYSEAFPELHATVSEPLYTNPPAAPVQEPVAWATILGSYAHVSWGKYRPDYPIRYEVPLYTTPPAAQRQWVGLTDVEWMNIVNKDQAWFGQRPDEVAHEVAKLVEAKLKEKNT